MVEVPLVHTILGDGRLPAVRQDTCVLIPADSVSRRPCMAMNSGGTANIAENRRNGSIEFADSSVLGR